MIPRLWTARVREKLTKFPAAALLGPRQCGKTTLARSLDGAYFDLETDADRLRLDAEWPVLAAGTRLVVLDEVHQAPEVFPRLRAAIDADRRRRGRFLLLGSVSPSLMTRVSESLAGRLGLVLMSPLLLPEIGADRLDDLWLRGGFPDGGIQDPALFPEWQMDYLNTLAMRDLPAWGLPARPQILLRLLHMLAALHGQPVNASQLGAGLALDHKTVLKYVDHLEGAFLVRRLPAFSGNLRKRLVRTPRLFWRDSGLLHALLGVRDADGLYRLPAVGASWEGFVVEQALGVLSAAGRTDPAFFFRTSDGIELDLAIDRGDGLWAVEAKLTSNPGPGDIEKLNRAADLIGATQRFLVCRIPRTVQARGAAACDLPYLLDRLGKG